jgi:hypothetical protein
MRGRHMGVVLQLVREHAPVTGSQLSDLVEGHPDFSIEAHKRLYQVRRRLSDLRLLNLVSRDGRLNSETLWVPVDSR